MLYIVHNFFENFMNAVESDDAILLTDIINDETAKLIVFDRGKLIETIKKSKTKNKLGLKPTDSQIIDIMVKEISVSPSLNDNIATLIIANNSDNNKPISAHLSATGGEPKEENKSKERTSTLKGSKKDAVKMALKMYINKDNEMLLKKKTAHHLKVKDMNFAADAEIVDLTKKKKAKLVAISVSATILGMASGYLITKYALKKGWFTKKADQQAQPTATTTPAPAPAQSNDNDD